MCDGAGRIGAQETVVVPSQGAYRTIGGWDWITGVPLSLEQCRKHHIGGVLPEVIPLEGGGTELRWVWRTPGVVLEVPAPGQQAAQDPSDGRRSRHDRSQQTTPSTSSPI